MQFSEYNSSKVYQKLIDNSMKKCLMNQQDSAINSLLAVSDNSLFT